MRTKWTAVMVAGGSMLALALLPVLAAEPGKLETYKIDAVHSTALFRVKHMNVSYSWGRFNTIGGTVAWNPADPAAARFEVEIKTDSIDTANRGRDTHLKGADFFDTKQYPAMSFKSKSARKAGDHKIDVTGDMTLHGVTREITIPIEATGMGAGRDGASLAGFEATFTIKRSEFGMDKMVGPVGDEVRIIVAIEASTK